MAPAPPSLARDDYDVVLVGGGPAGCAFARTFVAQNPGGRLLLVDASRFPRDKTCGDALTFQAIPAIHSVFPELTPVLPTRSATTRQILHYWNGRRLVHHGSMLDVIPRRDLDNTLFQAAVRAGVPTLEGARVLRLIRDGERVCGAVVRTETEERTLTCRWLIGADGSQSIVRRETGPLDRDHVIHALRHYVRGIPESTEGLVFFFDREYRGYFWIFPFVKDGERWANVGYGNETDNRALKPRFQHYCESPEVRAYLGEGRFEGKPVGFPLNLGRFDYRGRLTRPLWGPGYLLLGDAASLVHPFTGEGISFAVESGRMAAEVLSDDRVPEADKGRVYEKRVLRRVRPIFLSFDKFAAIRLPMILPRPLGNALVNAAAFAQRLTGWRAQPLEIAAQTGILMALVASLLAFWAAHVAGREATGSPYGLRATLFAALTAAFCLLHARTWQGTRFAWRFFFVTFTSSLAVEAIGISTGFVFGAYRYGPDVPAKIFGLVPTVVPVMWFVVSYLSLAAAHALEVRPVAIMATALLVSYDLVSDPNHLHRGGWSYAGGGSYYGVPAQNFAAWFVIGLVGFAVVERLRRLWGQSGSPSDLSLAVTAYAIVILHESLFAFGIAGYTGPGVIGLAVLTGVLVLWSRARRPAVGASTCAPAGT